MRTEPGTIYTFRYYSNEALVSTRNMTLASDAEAIELAEEAQFGFRLQIWDDGRLVVDFRNGSPREAEKPQ